MAKYTTNPEFQEAVSNALASQSWFQRRKDTIAAVAGGVLQVLNILMVFATDWPEWASLLIGALIFVAQAFFHATTQGAITPSMGDRLERHAPRREPQPSEPDTDAFHAGSEAAAQAGQATPNRDFYERGAHEA